MLLEIETTHIICAGFRQISWPYEEGQNHHFLKIKLNVKIHTYPTFDRVVLAHGVGFSLLLS